ncbi:type II toxin-antitoxin system Phd/YefM family antitoxin [Limisalsivibrio acetivorans]|uniref:type II toxin-antitoxin system Phd/YefM family antitoxin n=1 Tax=Limisalsivibrio acetivorans TaxID=1304888 RepID=UPI0003B458AB|nr:type II toxin-antitoxin system Phd/YefM family antitoxin [Limisalsivibrio acetivorans]
MGSVKYELSEMMSASSFSRNMSKVSELLDTMRRVVVLRNNTPEMVVLPVEDYELMKSIMDLAEHLEIAKLIEERRSEQSFSLDEVLDDEGIAVDEQ